MSGEPTQFAVADVETTLIKTGEIPKTKFWGFADSRGYHSFKTTGKLLKFLDECEPRTILHHSNFDVIQLLVDGADVRILKSHNGRLIKCKIGHHYLLNSFSVFPVALKKIFAAFGFKKTDLGQLAKRNYEDCVNGLHCFLELDRMFQSLVFVSPLNRGTIAATGFAAAEKHSGKMPKDLRFLEAYRGGRVEVFDTREIECSNYDIHSSYPRSFLECPAKDVLMRVRVKTNDWHGPLFADGDNDLLLFPNGVFESWVYQSNWEKYIEPFAEKTTLKVLSKHKIDFSWLRSLTPLIQTIYEKKRTSGGGIELCCKLLLNSLYGRIGLRGASERARILDYEPDLDGGKIYPLPGGRYLAFDEVERESRANFPFAAFITDNGRARLFHGFKKNRPAYGDTDSIFTPVTESKFNGKLGDGCGEWGYNGRDTFQACNVKDYIFGKKVVRKGGDENTVWTLKRFAQGKTAKRIVRTRQTGLRKREVLHDGSTRPLVVNK